VNAKRIIGIVSSWFAFVASAAVATLTAPPAASVVPAAIFDTEARRIPQIVEADYIELQKVAAISKFRSAVGHDYSDDFETCRSMKHYFRPREGSDWAAVQIYSPVNGIVFRTEEEWAGTKIEIRADRCPAFMITIFHVRLLKPIHPGEALTAGQVLGFHVGKQTFSDIAVSVNTPKGRKLVSYLEVMAEAVFNKYRARGLRAREDVIIPKAARDADPLICQEGKFKDPAHEQDWVSLKDNLLGPK
jgi:hypothetical protein